MIKLCKLIFGLCIFLYSTSNIFASELYLEEFNSTLSLPSLWEFTRKDGITFENIYGADVAKFDKFTSTKYPYIRTKNLGTDNVVNVDMKIYKQNGATSQGAGIILSDIIPLEGSPPNFQSILFYIWPKPSGVFYLFTSLCPNTNPLCDPSQQLSNGVVELPINNWSEVSFKKVGESYEFYLDKMLKYKSIDTKRIINYVAVGQPEIVNNPASWPVYYIDYIKINSSQDSLPVPYLSQRDNKWKDIEYDSANTWAGSEANSIERWGCALTSVAMILQKYNVKMPDGNVANPDLLNSWLIGESDGYVGNGLLNWLAISRLTRQSRIAGNSTIDLEFVKSNGTPSEEITAGFYPIVNTGSHFVVTHGQDSTNYLINDPFEASKSAIAKSQSLASINTFYPSNTDLSNIMIVGSNNLVATMSGSTGIVQVESFDESITDDLGGSSTQIRSFYVHKPTTDTYRLLLNNNAIDSERSDLYLYNINGVATKKEILLLPGETKTIVINYDKTGVQESTTTELDTTPPPTPVNLSPSDNTYATAANLIFTWEKVSDPSLPITYWYKSSWNGGSYGPVSTGGNSYINASGSADREYSWYVKACDSASNCSGWSSGTKLIVDSVKPIADLVFPSPGPSSTYFDVVFSEKMKLDSVSNPANYFLNNWPEAGGSGDLLGDATISYDENTNTARVNFSRAGWYISPEQQWGVSNTTDLAGNVLITNPTTEYSTAMIAPTIPVVSTLLSTPTNSSEQKWVWSSSDSGSGIKGYYERIYDVLKLLPSEWIWAGNVVEKSTQLGDGVWQFEVKAEDNAGNVSNVGSSSELVVDTIAPNAPSLLSPTDKVVTNGKFLVQDWSDVSDASKYVYESYNDSALKSLRYRGTFNISQKDASNIVESTYWWRVAAVDLAGNQSQWSEVWQIVIDNTAPQLVSKTSFSGWYREMQSSYFDYTDQHMASGYLAPSCKIGSEGRAQSCLIVPNVCDSAGNCNTTKQSSNVCDIDRTPPTTLLNAWGSTIDGSASDSLSGVERTEIEITKPDSSTTTVNAVGTNNWSYTMPESPLANYKIVVASYDKAGNKGIEIVKEFVMSESARSTQVLGASTEKIDEKSERREVAGEIKTGSGEDQEEKEVEEVVSEEGNNESVLGEKTENKSKNWWWLALIPLAGFLYWGGTKLFGE